MFHFKKTFIVSAALLLLTGIFFLADFEVRGAVSKAAAETSEEIEVSGELEEQTAAVKAIEKTLPAVVNITVYQTEEVTQAMLPDGEKQTEERRVEQGAGTGFIISPDGYIITNKHVVFPDKEEDVQYRVLLSSGKKYYAQLIDTDPLHDLAVLKIFDKDLPSADIGASGDVKVGFTALAIGNALGEYQNTVTKGIISGLDRSVVAGDERGGSRSLSNVIQTDANINLGNSGGPLVDLKGEVVGVNVATDRRGSDIGFAIPIDDVKPIMRSVKERGLIVRPYLGVRYIMLTPQLARKKEAARDRGALVTAGGQEEAAVMDSSPAEAAGLKSGDIIFEINGIEIRGEHDLRSVTQWYQPGDRIGLKIQRGNKVLIREVELGELRD